jgi:hypothetical protein
VDRNVYCTPVSVPANSTSVKYPVDGNPLKLGASLKFTCTQQFWYFNYSLPQNLVSYYYSNNINTTTLKCNIYG